MKKTILLTCSALLACLSLSAQEKPRYSKYLNLSYVTQKTSYVDNSWGEMPEFKSDFGAALSYGRSFYLHKKPLLGMIRFGIDATFIDLNYGNYSYEWYEEDDWDDYYWEKYKIHQAEIGVQFGPSVTVTPIKGLNIHGWFRYAPSFALMYDAGTDGVSGAFGNFFVAGGSVSYRNIGVGVEARWGRGNYKEFGGGEEEDDWDWDYDYGRSEKNKLKTTGMRVFLTIRF